MSQSIEYVLALGGSIHAHTDRLAIVYVDEQTKKNIITTLNTTESNNYPCEWQFDDGSIIRLWNAGSFQKQPFYFMAYSIEEANDIRYRRANPTPDTSHE